MTVVSVIRVSQINDSGTSTSEYSQTMTVVPVLKVSQTLTVVPVFNVSQTMTVVRVLMG